MIIVAKTSHSPEGAPSLDLMGDAEEVKMLKMALISRALGVAATIEKPEALADLHTFIDCVVDYGGHIPHIFSDLMPAIFSDEAVASRQKALFESARRGSIAIQAYLDENKLHQEVRMSSVCLTSEGLFAKTDGSFKPNVSEFTPEYIAEYSPYWQNVFRALGATHYVEQSDLIKLNESFPSLRSAPDGPYRHLSVGVVDASGNYQPRATLFDDDHLLVELADGYEQARIEDGYGPDVIGFRPESSYNFGSRVNFIGMDNYFLHGPKAAALYGKSSVIETETQ